MPGRFCCLSAGNAAMPSDVISICVGQSVVATAPHWLHFVVLPAVPLPPLPADDAAEDGVQATDSAAPTGSGATGSGLGAGAGVRCSCLNPVETLVYAQLSICNWRVSVLSPVTTQATAAPCRLRFKPSLPCRSSCGPFCLKHCLNLMQPQAYPVADSSNNSHKLYSCR